MRDELKFHYENELISLRNLGSEFAEKYKNIAARLTLSQTGGPAPDPHVERLVEAFAFLAARIQLRLNDDFPEITEALLGVLYPHYVRPIPSMSVVEFEVDPSQVRLTSSVTIPRHSTLLSKPPIEGMSCKFRTCYETTVAPIRVTQARWATPSTLKPAVNSPTAAAVCALELTCFPDVTFQILGLKTLRFYLSGDDSVRYSLYELLLNNCMRIVLRNPDDPRQALIELPADSLVPVGFHNDDAVLPYPRRSFTGYRILQEYFAFPDKFLFLDLNNLGPLSGAFKNKVEILFLIKPFEGADRQQSLEQGVRPKTFRLGVSPIVNLFQQSAEPILMEQTRFEYQVVANARRPLSMEIFSIDEVVTASPDRGEVTRYEPFYASQHGQSSKGQTFWHASRRPSTRPDDNGTEMFLSMVNGSGAFAGNMNEAITVRCTLTNRDLPTRLRAGAENGDFDLERGSPVRKIVALREPTPPRRIESRESLHWRLVSHLSLNYLSLVEDGCEALQNLLRLYNFGNNDATVEQIKGIMSVGSRRHYARVVSDQGISFARGIRVDMKFDEDFFAGSGVYLFASVLEYFLGLYTSLNSFSQLVAHTKQRKEVLREWRPRAGQKILL